MPVNPAFLTHIKLSTLNLLTRIRACLFLRLLAEDYVQNSTSKLLLQHPAYYCPFTVFRSSLSDTPQNSHFLHGREIFGNVSFRLYRYNVFLNGLCVDLYFARSGGDESGSFSGILEGLYKC